MDEASDPADSGDASARENLRVIRELMERATVYRAIAAVPALIGGLLAIAISVIFWFRGDAVGKATFVLAWLGALIVIEGLNTWLLFRESKSRQGEFPSQKMIHGILAMAPPMIVLGIFGLILAWVHEEFIRCTVVWTIGYGLGLLATSSFAPESIRRLGWQFLLLGTVFMVVHEFGLYGDAENPVRTSALFMGLSFGCLHLGYWFRTRREAMLEA